MDIAPRITPCSWFDSQAEEAAKVYIGIFPNSKVAATTRYGESGHEIHGRAAGSVMTVEFELERHAFTALNGGPLFQFNEAISFQVNCETQEEIDFYWDKLEAGGDPEAQQCGWLKDKFGVSWQVIPRGMADMLREPESEVAARAMTAMMGMKKIDLAALRRAFAG